MLIPWSEGRPCKIVEMSTSKTGKHGHAKVHLVAIDVRVLLPMLKAYCSRMLVCPSRSSLAKKWSVDAFQSDNAAI